MAGDVYLGSDPGTLMLEAMCSLYALDFEVSDPEDARPGSAPGMTLDCAFELRDAVVRAEGGDPDQCGWRSGGCSPKASAAR